MFACIYFSEDDSLSVVGRADKNLKSNEDNWKENELVEMKWGKKVYTGTIIRINDDEDQLNKFANAANKKVLLNKDIGKENKLEELLAFSLKPVSDRKRARVQTEKIIESKEQEKENEVSSQKTKKRKNEASVPKKNEKKKQETITMAIEKEILSDLNSQFSTKPQEREQDSISTKTTEKEQDEEPEATSLTTTWRLCNPALQDVACPGATDHEPHEQQTITPPQKVVQLFELLLDPTVNSYMRKVVNQFGKKRDPNVQDILAQETFYNMDSPMTNNNEAECRTATPFISLQQMPMSSMLAGPDDMDFDDQFYSSTIHMPTPGRSPRNGIEMPVEDKIEVPTGFRSCSQPPNPGPSPYTTAMPQRTSPRKMAKISSTVVGDDDPPVFPAPLASPSAYLTTPKRTSPRKTLGLTSASPSAYLTTPKRTSPRKTSTINEFAGSAMEKQNLSKLLDHSNVFIDKEILTTAVRLSKKSSKPAYTLTMKLMPGLFTTEEMATSRGQGILAKKGDLRPALDKEKITVLKDYVRCWCKANAFSNPSDSLLNEAITEKVSYARKQLKRRLYTEK